MGVLIDGVWQPDGVIPPESAGGGFFNWVTPDGSPGPTGTGGFTAEAGRYHLYISFACPFAERALIMRSLKNLSAIISVSSVNALRATEGWTFDEGRGVIPDYINNARTVHDLYTLAKSDFTGRCTVPILWDKKTKTIVSNESADIMLIFNSAFDGIQGVNKTDYYPENETERIDKLNALIGDLQGGIARAGLTSDQKVYDTAVENVFLLLDNFEGILAEKRYLTGGRMTLADRRLFPILVRFDSVSYSLFKCNKRRIVDYPNLSNYLRDLYQTPGVRENVDIEHCKEMCYRSYTNLNPSGVVPVGPELLLDEKHDRDRLSQ